ncbi:MAG: phosphotransferase [Pararhodobacter sp.]
MSAALPAGLLAHWGLEGAPCRLVAHRENRVYAVQTPQGRAALRLHRPGYHAPAALQSELDFMAHLAAAGLRVPAPLPTGDGALLVSAGEPPVMADLLRWLEGEPLGRAGEPLPWADPAPLFHALGAALARLHHAADAFDPPAGFSRPAWNEAGLLGEAPLWGRFWENPALTAEERALLLRARDAAHRALGAFAPRADYGLIHADAVRENVLVHEGAISLIDFDDCGYGFRLFDLATALHPNRAEPGFAEIEAALMEGYRHQRALGPEAEAALGLFALLRAFTYVGWIMARGDAPEARARNRRFIDRACALARDWA